MTSKPLNAKLAMRCAAMPVNTSMAAQTKMPENANHAHLQGHLVRLGRSIQLKTSILQKMCVAMSVVPIISLEAAAGIKVVCLKPEALKKWSFVCIDAFFRRGWLNVGKSPFRRDPFSIIRRVKVPQLSHRQRVLAKTSNF